MTGKGTQQGKPERPDKVVELLMPAEQKAVGAWAERRKRASPRIKAHGRDGDAALVGTDHPDQAAGFALLMEAVGPVNAGEILHRRAGVIMHHG
ncbi:MAG TPA: hypothetical protein VK839_04370 [Erythrobacter sp.]|nr:hypothetical protein [Erythrobacter sp.]